MKPTTLWAKDAALATGVKQRSSLMAVLVDHLREQGNTCRQFHGHVRNAATGTISRLTGSYDDTAAALNIIIFDRDTKQEDTLSVHYISGYWSLTRSSDPLTGGPAIPATELASGKLAVLPPLPNALR